MARKHLRSARHRALIRELSGAREAAGMTQRELARRLDRSHSFVGKIESGERQLNVLDFFEYVAAMDADPVTMLQRILR